MTPSAKLTLVSSRFQKVAAVVTALGAIATIASGAEWLDREDRGELMSELVDVLQSSEGAERILEIKIWADSHMPGFAKAFTGKMAADLSDKPPLSREIADRLKEGFRRIE